MSFTTPFFIILAGAWTAPGRHFVVGVTMAILVALALGGVYTLAFTGDPRFGLRGWESLHYGVTPVLNLLGLSISLFVVWGRWKTE